MRENCRRRVVSYRKKNSSRLWVRRRKFGSRVQAVMRKRNNKKLKLFKLKRKSIQLSWVIWSGCLKIYRMWWMVWVGIKFGKELSSNSTSYSSRVRWHRLAITLSSLRTLRSYWAKSQGSWSTRVRWTRSFSSWKRTEMERFGGDCWQGVCLMVSWFKWRARIGWMNR